MPQGRWKKLFHRLLPEAPQFHEREVLEDHRASGRLPLAEPSENQGTSMFDERSVVRLHTLLRRSARKTDEKDEHVEEILGLVDKLAAQQDTGWAMRIMAPFSQRLDDHPKLALRLATILYGRGRVAEAVDVWEQLAALESTASQAHLALAEHYQRQGDMTRALVCFENVLARDFTCTAAREAADHLRTQLLPPFSNMPTIVGGREAGVQHRFAIERDLGGGGGGRVYLALDRKLQRPVAIKVIHRHIARQTALRMRLFCEARIAASLPHPQIITVYDLDETLGLIAMEYCAGGTLAARFETGQTHSDGSPCSSGEAFRWLGEMCTVLEVVHRAGVVHGDIKPGNWLFRRPGSQSLSPLVLTDFGSARVALEQPDQKDLGTLAYAMPEQQAGQPALPQADLYACGLIVLELLLGRRLTPRFGVSLGEQALADRSIWTELNERLPNEVAIDTSRLLRDLLNQCVRVTSIDAEQTQRRALDLQIRIDRHPRQLHRCSEPVP